MNIFKNVQMVMPKQNRFDLSHDLKLSFKMGYLVPTCNMEVLPGDRVTIQPQTMLRFAPLVSPVMHRVRVTTHYFFVPNRLLWPDWDKWITGELDVEAPYVQMSNMTPVAEGSLYDYLGLPVAGPPSPQRFSPMSAAAYRLIWDEYYRDQNLQNKRFEPLEPGSNMSAYNPADDTEPYRRAWEHDYFTSALPFAQKGDDVLIPLVNEPNIPVEFQEGHNPIMRKPSTGAADEDGNLTVAGGQLWNQNEDENTALDPNGSLVVDIQAGATDINTLRRAFRLQEWLEKNARGGTRYVENIMAHFGVKSSDARLQRPEYIGGAKQNMVISEVLSTAQSDNDPGTATVPVGQMAGHGISVGGGNAFTYKAEEHGIIIGIVNVQPDTAYMQGLHRQFTRFDKLDYAWPTFANIGEQEVLEKEVYVMSPEPDATFGYQSRYAEYKNLPSRVAGNMRSSLAFWHLGRIFGSAPALNEDFIQSDPDTRIFAVETGDHIFAHVFNRITAVRKLPRFGTPTI